MKSRVLYFIICSLCFSTCSTHEDKNTATAQNHGSDVPPEVRGVWISGAFSISEFQNYKGQYLGNAFKSAIAFVFTKDGYYEQYQISQSQNKGCVLHFLRYSRGTITFDESKRTFTVSPLEGKLKGFDDCFGGNSFDRSARREELDEQTIHYSLSAPAGKTKGLGLKFSPDGELLVCFKTVDD